MRLDFSRKNSYELRSRTGLKTRFTRLYTRTYAHTRARVLICEPTNVAQSCFGSVISQLDESFFSLSVHVYVCTGLLVTSRYQASFRAFSKVQLERREVVRGADDYDDSGGGGGMGVVNSW